MKDWLKKDWLKIVSLLFVAMVFVWNIFSMTVIGEIKELRQRINYAIDSQALNNDMMEKAVEIAVLEEKCKQLEERVKELEQKTERIRP